MPFDNAMFKTYPGRDHPFADDTGSAQLDVQFPLLAGVVFALGDLYVQRIAVGTRIYKKFTTPPTAEEVRQAIRYRYTFEVRDRRIPGEAVSGPHTRRAAIALALSLLASDDDTVRVYPIEVAQEVYCEKTGCKSGPLKRGLAFLCGPDHSPCDGNAHFFCREHLDADAVIAEDRGNHPAEEP